MIPIGESEVHGTSSRVSAAGYALATLGLIAIGLFYQMVTVQC